MLTLSLTFVTLDYSLYLYLSILIDSYLVNIVEIFVRKVSKYFFFMVNIHF